MVTSWAKGKHFSEEHKRKIGEANRRRVVTDETKRKISESRKKLFATSIDAHINLSKSLQGRVSSRKGAVLTEETKQKIRENRKGKGTKERNVNYKRVFTEEELKNLSERMVGKPGPRLGATHTDSAKEKLRICHTGMKATEETKRKMGINKHREKNPNWRGGTSFGGYCPKFDDKLKENVRAFCGGKCVICEKTREQNNGERLSVHHVFTERMTCCETKIEDMENVRSRLPKDVARFGEPTFGEIEILYIRMMVPLCRSHHGYVEGEKLSIPYEETVYRKHLTEFLLKNFGGRCYNDKDANTQEKYNEI